MKRSKKYPYELATKAQRKIGYPWWCIHHEEMVEPLTEPIENRVEYIRTGKPKHEWETRLRALRPMKSPPRWMMKVCAAYAKPYEELQKSFAAWVKAEAARMKAVTAQATEYTTWQNSDAKAVLEWMEALSDHWSEIDALFAVECSDVKWDENGLVFPKEKPKKYS